MASAPISDLCVPNLHGFSQDKKKRQQGLRSGFAHSVNLHLAKGRIVLQSRRIKCNASVVKADATVEAEKAEDPFKSLSQVCAVLGTQWGDEGKGKLVDVLAQRYDIVAHCQGLTHYIECYAAISTFKKSEIHYFSTLHCICMNYFAKTYRKLVCTEALAP